MQLWWYVYICENAFIFTYCTDIHGTHVPLSSLLFPLLQGMGLGVQFTRRTCSSMRQPTQGSGNVSGASSNRESLSSGDGNGSGGYIFRALYSFHGTNEDEVCIHNYIMFLSCTYTHVHVFV